MKNKILIYFPDTGGYNFTPPYEALFIAKSLYSAFIFFTMCLKT